MLSFDRYFKKDIFAVTSNREADFTLEDPNNTYNLEQSNFISSNFNFFIQDIFSIKQVHGSEVVVLKDTTDGRGKYDEADGIITNILDLPIAIRTADCLPVFILDEVRDCFGLVHAGWRSSEKNILEKVLFLLESEFGSNPAELKVVFGPCIRDCCYEVDEKFLRYFSEDIIIKDGYFLNLPSANKRQLIKMGVREENIIDCNICTCCDENYFSYRREGGKTGRMISLMMMKDKI